MKNRNLLLALITLSVLTWSCSKNEDPSSGSSSLKSALNTNVNNLSTAINSIISTDGYQILASNTTLKSATESPVDSLLTNQILLSDIYGIYDYVCPSLKRGPINIQRFFLKTADNSQMVVRLPEQKVKSPRSMFVYNPKDTLLVNNYVITVSEYQYKFKPFIGWDYKMGSSIKIKDVDAGILKICSSKNRIDGYKYASEFAFPNGYLIKCAYTSGDTAVSSYTISKDGKTLYEEKFTAIKVKNEFRHKEREFILTIGDVQIVRGSTLGHGSLDSAKVYVSGVLQLNAKVEIVNKSTDPTATTITCKKRELKITFDDGTSKTFTELAGATIDNISSLFAAMRQVTFSTDVIDWIAWDTYRHNKGL